MIRKSVAALSIAAILAVQWTPWPAYADNPMGYRLLSAQEASQLPRNRGALGIDVERAQQITDAEMTFDIMRVTQVRPGSAGAQAGFRRGDQIVAVDGRVFPSIAAFAAYVGSVPPGSRLNVDYIPAGGGPEKAERVAVVVGAAGMPAPRAPNTRDREEPVASGMSTRTKIGLGVAALVGCYAIGCFSSRSGSSAPQQSYGATRR